LDPELKKAIEHWRRKADNDLLAAERLISGDNPLTDSACFHCQQAAEKYLKLFLVTKNIAPPKTHNLAVILGECVSLYPEFNSLTETVYLTDYGVAVRYPDDFYLPDLTEAEKAVEDARFIREFVSKKLPK